MTTAPRVDQGGLMATTWQLTIDCEAPTELAAFWAAALGYVPSPVPRAGLQLVRVTASRRSATWGS
ncbi:MAG: VOC family protein [Nocardioidaceae bacterium]